MGSPPLPYILNKHKIKKDADNSTDSTMQIGVSLLLLTQDFFPLTADWSEVGQGGTQEHAAALRADRLSAALVEGFPHAFSKVTSTW